MTIPDPAPVHPVALGYVTAGLAMQQPVPLPPAWRTTPLRVVLVCWAVPLATGLIVFAGAMVSGQQHFEGPWVRLGLLDLAIGTGLAGMGGIAILAFVAGRWQAAAGGSRWKLLFGPAVGAAVLLASNFGVAVLLVLLLAQANRI